MRVHSSAYLPEHGKVPVTLPHGGPTVLVEPLPHRLVQILQHGEALLTERESRGVTSLTGGFVLFVRSFVHADLRQKKQPQLRSEQISRRLETVTPFP